MRRLFILTIIFLYFVICAPAYAQITITQTQPLNFGTILKGPTGGTVRVRPNGTISGSSSLTLLGGHSRGVFLISAPNRPTVTFSFSTNNILSANGQSVVLSSMDSNRTSPFRLANGGSTMNVGGTITIPNNSLGGNLTGTYILTVELQ